MVGELAAQLQRLGVHTADVADAIGLTIERIFPAMQPHGVDRCYGGARRWGRRLPAFLSQSSWRTPVKSSGWRWSAKGDER